MAHSLKSEVAKLIGAKAWTIKSLCQPATRRTKPPVREVFRYIFKIKVEGDMGMNHQGVVNGLIRILNKDLDTYLHSIRVGKLAKLMANLLNIDRYQTRDFLIGCCLHDVGKVLIPDRILKKPSSLNRTELENIKRHPIMGYYILLIEGINHPRIVDIIKFHHERWDGLGYPYGLKAQTIPNLARICAIIDAFDCMVSDRPYRKGMSFEGARHELLAHSGSQFDPFYIHKFIHILDNYSLDEYDKRDSYKESIRIL